MDSRIAALLLRWRSVSKYVALRDYVFATDAHCAGHKRGLQPASLATIMQYHISSVRFLTTDIICIRKVIPRTPSELTIRSVEQEIKAA